MFAVQLKHPIQRILIYVKQFMQKKKRLRAKFLELFYKTPNAAPLLPNCQRVTNQIYPTNEMKTKRTKENSFLFETLSISILVIFFFSFFDSAIEYTNPDFPCDIFIMKIFYKLFFAFFPFLFFDVCKFVKLSCPFHALREWKNKNEREDGRKKRSDPNGWINIFQVIAQKLQFS